MLRSEGEDDEYDSVRRAVPPGDRDDLDALITALISQKQMLFPDDHRLGLSVVVDEADGGYDLFTTSLRPSQR